MVWWHYTPLCGRDNCYAGYSVLSAPRDGDDGVSGGRAPLIWIYCCTVSTKCAKLDSAFRTLSSATEILSSNHCVFWLPSCACLAASPC